MQKKLVFRGACCALVTPMKGEKPDYTAMKNLIEAQIKGGTNALVIGGTTGEAATLSDSERYEIYSFAHECVGGRIPLIFGTGTNDTHLAIEHTRTAESIGCDAVLVVTPYYNKGTQRGITEHYKRIAASAELPIILYNVPSRTGVNLSMKQIEELARVESIVGIKEAADSADRLTELSKFGSDLYLYAGNDSAIYSVLALGGAGVISVVSNIFPEKISEMCRAYFDGDTKRAHEEQIRLFNFIRLMFLETNPAPIKYAMSLVGMCSSDLRLPLSTPEKATRDAIEAEIRRLCEKK